MFRRGQLTVAMTIYSYSSALGPAAATMIGGLVIGASHGGMMHAPFVGDMPAWRAALIVTGLPGLLLAPLIFIVSDRRRRAKAPNARAPAPAADETNLVGFLKKRRVFLTCHFLGFSALALVAYGSATWTPAFLMRTHGWSPTTVGLLLPLFSNAALLASSVGALIVDRQLARGWSTIHFDYYILGSIIIGAAGAVAFLTTNIAVTAAGLGMAFAFLAAGGVSASALQLATPPELRGRVAALSLFVSTLIGATIGPTIVGAFTQFVFHDDLKVGWGIAATYALFSPVALICFILGRSALRDAIAIEPQISEA